jgi:hypothetical protein
MLGRSPIPVNCHVRRPLQDMRTVGLQAYPCLGRRFNFPEIGFLYVRWFDAGSRQQGLEGLPLGLDRHHWGEMGPARRTFTVETDQLAGSPNPVFPADLHDAIRRRAEEIYIQSGRIPGRDADNWAQAEREILAQAQKRNRRAAIIIRVNGVQYVGEYLSESSDGYVPGEFGVGSSVAVRLEGEKMFVRRSNGKELVTRIVRKSR